jgi:hypothetical protein
MIRFRCQDCGKKLKADETIIGRRVECSQCGQVTRVPQTDNLALPESKPIMAKPLGATESKSLSSKLNQPSSRLETSKPKLKKPKLDRETPVDIGLPELNDDEGPIEMISHAAPEVAIDVNKFEPRFKSAKKSERSPLTRNIILGVVGFLILAGGVTLALNRGRIMDAWASLSTDYARSEEVLFYRNAVSNLEKARRQMYIAGRSLIALKSVDAAESEEIDSYNESIIAMTTGSKVLDQFEQLIWDGEENKAKALLVNTAVELANVRKEVDQKTASYVDKSY